MHDYHRTRSLMEQRAQSSQNEDSMMKAKIRGREIVSCYRRVVLTCLNVLSKDV
jgi:hypothetical protein